MTSRAIVFFFSFKPEFPHPYLRKKLWKLIIKWCVFHTRQNKAHLKPYHSNMIFFFLIFIFCIPVWGEKLQAGWWWWWGYCGCPYVHTKTGWDSFQADVSQEFKEMCSDKTKQKGLRARRGLEVIWPNTPGCDKPQGLSWPNSVVAIRNFSNSSSRFYFQKKKKNLCLN